ncbi:MAG TPA: serine--tRNA ligase [Gammaproteobacteria bacterium]|mgnify:FL=1|jgi:seryl-tRNA synthetase|nr:MAG: serine--tRNA ligase [Candidatus Thioglobus sp. MED-G23]RPG01500.1 MAG: serine--tRNA ligase [Proteobacteria bacterium TMED51]HAU40409.1 serine--tRNA ligase [Gammaproteobacteria bacterium]|tara:strand:- start:944 stop:2221 length:1278 start_codon:yes stop_codon:yes gene_type:complete
MLDPQLLRAEAESVAERLTVKKYILDVEKLGSLEDQRKGLQSEVQDLQAERNRSAKEVGRRKAAGEDVSGLIEETSGLAGKISAIEKELEGVRSALDELMHGIPNLPAESVPFGDSDEDNEEVRRWGDPTTFAFEPADHVSLGSGLGMMDFELAAKITGSRFVVMSGAIARLHRALVQFMLDLHTTEHGYQETYVPYLVNANSLFGTGQLPKFAEDQFVTSGDPSYFLIPTAEVPVTNIYAREIVSEEELPIRHVCHTPCFRSEAGSYGKDTRGMIRQHQFEKVELVQLVRPEHSWDALEELTGHAETVLQRLELPYRVVTLCGGDLGFSSAKTYDLEVWLPGQNQYREISSCSNFESFQARRMQARWRNNATSKPELLHTLNGSGLAVGRTLVALMENFQDANGTISIPDALRAYMGGLESISP